ncbi:MAG TPA: glycosyltransferase family 2 protein [Bdellovibrionota bacterium]|jgi:glycosyltransferase involved in cell wall biosynthesis
MQCVLAMPAYNEEECIAAVVNGWTTELRRRFGSGFRMVVVNDGSRDRTGAILDSLAREIPELVVIHQPNGGHGSALYTAYHKALEFHPDWVFQTDSDDQFSPSDFGSLWDMRATSRFLLGRRKVRHDAKHRLFITRILRALIFAMFRANLRDCNVPYRLIEGGYLRGLLRILPPDMFAPNIFLSVLAARDGQQLWEIPISHKDRQTGTVSILRWKLLRVCFRCAGELIRFRLQLRQGLRELELITQS